VGRRRRQNHAARFGIRVGRCFGVLSRNVLAVSLIWTSNAAHWLLLLGQRETLFIGGCPRPLFDVNNVRQTAALYQSL
jgi:hypothetical protein